MHAFPYLELRPPQQLPVLFASQQPGHLPRLLLKGALESRKEGFRLGLLLGG
jgi:hypothetical protein